MNRPLAESLIVDFHPPIGGGDVQFGGVEGGASPTCSSPGGNRESLLGSLPGSDSGITSVRRGMFRRVQKLIPRGGRREN